MDTPGGTVSGNEDLANAVARFKEAGKPIYAFTEDMTASAGVSIASQASKRYANSKAALYGSMGVYAVLVDYSGRADQLGIKVHVIKAGEFKGAGTEGTEITASQLVEAQRIVNTLYENYIAMIAKGTGLGLESVRAVADGRVYAASEATTLGLIHGVKTLDEAYAELVSETKSRPTKASPLSRSKTMEPATLAELKAKFPNSTAEWRESQLEAGATLQDAAINYAAHVEAKAKTDREQHEKELAEAKEAAKSPSLGHDPVRTRGKSSRAASERSDDEASERDEYVESGDAIEDFNAAVAKLAGPKADLQRRQRAIRTVATRDPELYEAYLLATNPGKRQSRLISEKMEAVQK
jgi:signal peptide peptidase SppA